MASKWAMGTHLALSYGLLLALTTATLFSQMVHGTGIGMSGPLFQKGEAVQHAPLSEADELKLAAMDSLMQSDPERAIPLLDKLLQNPHTPMRLKVRALRALASNDSAKARDVVVRVAKDGSNIDLQLRAVQYLNSREGDQSRHLMGEIYTSTGNAHLKRNVLRSWAGAGARDEILNAAKSDSDPEVRGYAMQLLAGMGEWQKLIDIAKTEKNVELRDRAVHCVGSMRSAGATEALVAMYDSTSEPSTRNTILRALSSQGRSQQIIALARKETNPALKRAALQHLSRMKGEEVTKYLMELIDK